MWYVYDKRSAVIQKTVKTPAAAKGWITRRQNEFMRMNDYFVTNLGPLFDWGYAEATYFHKHIEKSTILLCKERQNAHS